MGGPDRHAAASRQIARLFQTTGERVISTFQAGQQAAGNAAPCRSHGTADCSCAVDSPPVLTAASWALQLSVSGQKVHPGRQTSWYEKDNGAQGELIGWVEVAGVYQVLGGASHSGTCLAPPPPAAGGIGALPSPHSALRIVKRSKAVRVHVQARTRPWLRGEGEALVALVRRVDAPGRAYSWLPAIGSAATPAPSYSAQLTTH